MSSYSYPPNILAEINKICKAPALEIYACFVNENLLLDDIEGFLAKAYKFIAENFSDLGTVEYCLKLNFVDRSSDGSDLTSSFILNEKAVHKQLFEINQNFKIINSDTFLNPSDSLLSKFTRETQSVIMYVLNGLDTKLFCKGFTLNELNARSPSAMPQLNKKFSRQARDYKYSLKDFYNERIRQNVSKHWHDQSKRILISGKTEDAFQDSLANWLRENIYAAKVLPKAKKISQDETDIEILEIGGNSYLIEIKWLGKNAANTTYGEPKIKAAINQVKNYLDIDKDVIEATLAVYDGRSLQEFEKLTSIDEEKQCWKEISECLSESMPLKGKAFVFFLINEPASVRKAI